MTGYYKIMLGKQSVYASQCLQGNFVGVDFEVQQDLTGHLPDDWRNFNHEFIPVYLSNHPGKSRVAAGLACGALWTVARGLENGDMLLCPKGTGEYLVGEVVGGYSYYPGEVLPHRRTVKWWPVTVPRADMSDDLKRSTGSIGTISDISKHGAEIGRLIVGTPVAPPPVDSSPVEDPSVFALEKHLEEFLVANWPQTALGQRYDIYEVDGERVGQQYPTDTGPLDILAVSKDKKELLVVELKRGRLSDVVVGQIQRYMGYVQEELAEAGQSVRGVIIGLEDDLRIRRALVVAPSISYYRYQISFKLNHGGGQPL